MSNRKRTPKKSPKRSKNKGGNTPKVRRLFGGAVQLDLKDLQRCPKFYEKSRYVKELNGDDFNNDVVTNRYFQGKPGLVMFYADWCPHCSNPTTRKMWNEIGYFCSPDVAVGAMNCNDKFRGNDLSARLIGVSGYPSIAYINSDGTVDHEMFGGERNKEYLVKFLCSKVKDDIKMCR